ncbi:MAG: hypothetical protein JW816_02290 [Candidatus Buchananbacteria bacterium]|nr:hypothetical protein [Candidatus Buchananbacteria bacterium]
MKLETKRQAVHILLFLLVFSPFIFDRIQMAGILAVLFLLASLFVPRSKFRVWFFRAKEKKYSVGASVYFLVLIILVLFFPLPAIIAGWSALSLGDGLATIIGLRYGRTKLPWNKQRSFVGSIAFAIGTFVGIVLAMSFLIPTLNPSYIVLVALFGGLVGAIVESLPLKIDDNLSVPLVVAILVSLI